MYEITVKKTTREQVKSSEYKRVGDDEDGGAKYGYVEDETTKDVSREVYTQKVDELDLVSVINAVNAPKETK